MRAFILLPLLFSTVLGAKTWTLGFYEKRGCTGDSPASFGDDKAWTCTNIDSTKTLLSVDGPVHNWEAILYNKNDCKGDSTIQTFVASTCANAAEYLASPKHYKSFKVGVSDVEY